PDLGRQIRRLVLRIAEQQERDLAGVRIAEGPHLTAVERVVAGTPLDQRHDRVAVAQGESHRRHVLALEGEGERLRTELLRLGLLPARLPLRGHAPSLGGCADRFRSLSSSKRPETATRALRHAQGPSSGELRDRDWGPTSVQEELLRAGAL